MLNELLHGSITDTIDCEWSMLQDGICYIMIMLTHRFAQDVHNNAYFGEGSGDIYLDDVGCNGNEANLIDCYHAG